MAVQIASALILGTCNIFHLGYAHKALCMTHWVLYPRDSLLVSFLFSKVECKTDKIEIASLTLRIFNYLISLLGKRRVFSESFPVEPKIIFSEGLGEGLVNPDSLLTLLVLLPVNIDQPGLLDNVHSTLEDGPMG